MTDRPPFPVRFLVWSYRYLATPWLGFTVATVFGLATALSLLSGRYSVPRLIPGFFFAVAYAAFGWTAYLVRRD